MDCSLPGSSVCGILQARILEWVAVSFSMGSSQTREQTHIYCIGRQILYHCTTREVVILYIVVKVLVAESCPILCDPMDCSPSGLLCRWNSPGKNTWVGSHSLLQAIFPTQGSYPGLLHCRQTITIRATREALCVYVNPNLLFYPFPYFLFLIMAGSLNNIIMKGWCNKIQSRMLSIL